MPTNEKKRALVTGGAGFIGSHLCERLLGEGYHVVCMDNLRTGTLENIAHLQKDADFEYVHHDVTEYIDYPGERRLDEVYHFASPASPADFERIPIPILSCSCNSHLAKSTSLHCIYLPRLLRPLLPPLCAGSSVSRRGLWS